MDIYKITSTCIKIGVALMKLTLLKSPAYLSDDSTKSTHISSLLLSFVMRASGLKSSS